MSVNQAPVDEPELPFWKLVLTPKMLIAFAMGFTSGLPFWVVIQLVQVWLKDVGIDHKTIGLFSLTMVPYTWKFVWAPLMDRYVPPFLGRRRGWALITQVLCALGIAAFALLDPVQGVSAVAVLTILVSFFSASQDVVVDAWRREILADKQLGLGTAMYVNAYRFAGLVPGSLSLVLADHLPWTAVWPITAIFMLVGVGTSVLAPEPKVDVPPPRTLVEAVVEPLRDLFSRGGLRGAGLLVAFLVTYKLGDSLATAQITPFYQDLGFTKTQIGWVAKWVGLTSSIVGAFAGGLVIARIGIHRSLWVFGIAQMIAILGFSVLATVGPDLRLLGVVVAAEYLCIGLGTAAFVAYMQRETNRRFTATQYALLSSITALPRTFVSATSGWLIEGLGWTGYFQACAALSIPGLLLLPLVAPWHGGDRT